MLTDDYWQMASLKKLLEGELRHYETRDKPRILMEGPNVDLVADLAIPVGMAFHELASNSSKFGALSRPQGRLDVRWTLGSSGDRQVVTFDWQERDGPEVDPPKRLGFGTTLLEKVVEKVVAVQCDAKVALNYHREGLHFAMVLPLRDTRLAPPTPDGATTLPFCFGNGGHNASLILVSPTSITGAADDIRFR
jgi:two-component sensor histidine kinase